MKNAFTMIELIFVIIILGVLAAIALPRMTASRNDALAASVAFNLADCVEFAGSAFIIDSVFDITSDSCVAATVLNTCFVLTPDNINGRLLVQHVPGALAGSVCLEAQTLVGNTNISSATGITHQF